MQQWHNEGIHTKLYKF